jgi:hypothetical protein
MKGNFMRNMVLALLTASIFASTAIAGPTSEKKKRDEVEAALAKGAAEVKDCGKTIKLRYDWATFDKIDFAKINTTREDATGKEVVNVGWIGHDVNELCKDKDYKQAMQKIDTVLYVPSLDNKITVKATLDGKTLRFENYINGSTRMGGNFASAAKSAL